MTMGKSGKARGNGREQGDKRPDSESIPLHRNHAAAQMSANSRVRVSLQNGVTMLKMGKIEIWDGADLCLLREMLREQIVSEKRLTIGVDMTYVKYVPSGFFGMLVDWYEKGVSIGLYSPQPRIKNMLWFRRFFVETDADSFSFSAQTKEMLLGGQSPAWNGEANCTLAAEKNDLSSDSVRP
jgi:hypothetical protein